MTIQQIADAIYAYHPELTRPGPTCDGFKCGFPEDECTGVVTTCQASVDVIRKTIALGYNMILVHEPSFYTHMDKTDWLEGKNTVYDEKRKLLDDHRIAIFRDHDHIHSHIPDGIFYGVTHELGWEKYAVQAPGASRAEYFRLPRQPLRQLAAFLKEKMGLNAVRVIGNLDAEIETVAFAGHIYPTVPEERFTTLLEKPEIDVIIPGELIDWTTAAYARDAGQLGRHKAILQVGHFSMEELGMKYAVHWLRQITSPDLPIQFIRSADLFQYVL